MATPPYTPEVAVWADEDHASIVAGLLDLMGGSIAPIAVGGPRDGAAGKLAESLGLAPYDDLRQMGVERPAAFLLLAVSEDESPADLAAALANGTTVLSLEPACSTLADYAELDRPPRHATDDSPAMPGRLVLLPRFTQTPGYLAATDPYDTLGDRRSVLVTSTGPAHDGSLFARLHDAWSTALCFCDTPEAIHAHLAHASATPADGPRGLTGRLSANASCPGGSSIALIAADNSPALPRTLTVLGDTGQLTVTPTGYHLRHADGSTIDQLIPPDGAPAAPPMLDQMADQWRRLLDQRNPPDEAGTRRDQQALACTLACLLSAKTGQPESPERVMQMSRG